MAVREMSPVPVPYEPLAEAAEQERFQRTRADELLRTLRREIFAAEMKVILDKELGRETSSTVKKLAGIKLPPV